MSPAPGTPVASPGRLRLAWRPYRFVLPRRLVTAHGALVERRGWLLRLETGTGGRGWGEAVAPDAGEREGELETAIAALGEAPPRQEVERILPSLPPSLAFALGAALAEADGVLGEGAGGWRPAPPSAWLLPAGEGMLGALERLAIGGSAGAGAAPTLKWKVATGNDAGERRLLETLLERLPAVARLRLDANGGWDRATAAAWADRLEGEGRLQWLEQPLDPDDGAGLEALARRLPVALDESLRRRPELREKWSGWQVRRPALEGDPRPLLAALAAGAPRRMVSTALETGIGRRVVHHLAALQALGPTPVAPGLAPGWLPEGGLFAADPRQVWEAAA